MTTTRDRTKPRLPWYRPRNLVRTACLLFLGLLAYLIFIALTAVPGGTMNYAKQLNELTRDNQPGDPHAPNRWLAYSAMLEDFMQIVQTADTPALDSLGKPLELIYAYDTHEVPEDLKASVRAEARACMDAVRASDIFSRLDTFTDPVPVYQVVPDNADLLMMLYPSYTQSRRLAQACAAEFRIALEEGRSDDAARAITHILTLSRVAAHHPILIAHLIAMSQSSLAMSQVRYALEHNLLDETTAIRILDTLITHELPTLAVAFSGEELMMLDIIQRTHTDNKNGNGMYLPAAFNSMAFSDHSPQSVWTRPFANAAGIVYPDKKTTTARAQTFYRAVRDQSTKTPYDRRNDPNLEQFVNGELGERDPILRTMLPAISTIIRNKDHAALDHRLTQTLLALTIYHARHADYPDTLDALVPQILPQLPADGFAPDAQFRYIKRTPTTDDPRPFLLYSVAADFTDNHGHADKHVIKALSSSNPGLDYVINPLPRDAHER